MFSNKCWMILHHIYLMCRFYSLSRIASQQGEGNEEDFSALDEPLPECTLAFTHGIGKQVTKKNKWLLNTFSFSELTVFLLFGWFWARGRAAFWDTSDLTGLRLLLVSFPLYLWLNHSTLRNLKTDLQGDIFRKVEVLQNKWMLPNTINPRNIDSDKQTEALQIKDQIITNASQIKLLRVLNRRHT